MQPTHACSLELLKTSLTEALGEAEETRLAEHLSHCSFCQCKLAEFAAVEGTWRQVTEVLKSESKELQARHDHESKLSGTSISTRAQASRDALADFAVNFFQACDYPDAIGQLGDVAILEVIGHGGMGVVLKGFQTKLNRPVTVKVLAPHLATSGAARQRFAREAQAVAVISHPNVMPIFAVDDSGQLPFIVMPYFDCESLQDRIDRCGSLPVLDSLRILLQVADGLAAAHEQGIVHRDIKPENLLLVGGHVKVADFGLVKDIRHVSQSLMSGMTPTYAAPELFDGRPCRETDQYSLAIVYQEMLTAERPFSGNTPAQLAAQHMHGATYVIDATFYFLKVFGQRPLSVAWIGLWQVLLYAGFGALIVYGFWPLLELALEYGDKGEPSDAEMAQAALQGLGFYMLGILGILISALMIQGAWLLR